jgi:hypothetical protein
VDISVPVIGLEGVGHIATLQNGVKVRAATFAEKVGIVRRRADTDGSSGSRKGIAKVVGLWIIRYGPWA